jgi:hypothetical protein
MKPILTLFAAALVLCSSCQKHQTEKGVPNDSGAAYQDHKGHRNESGVPFDGSQGALIPGSRH